MTVNITIRSIALLRARRDSDRWQGAADSDHAIDQHSGVGRIRAGPGLGEAEPADADGRRGDLAIDVGGECGCRRVALEYQWEGIGCVQGEMPEVEGRFGAADLAEVDGAGVAAVQRKDVTRVEVTVRQHRTLRIDWPDAGKLSDAGLHGRIEPGIERIRGQAGGEGVPGGIGRGQAGWKRVVAPDPAETLYWNPIDAGEIGAGGEQHRDWIDGHVVIK